MHRNPNKDNKKKQCDTQSTLLKRVDGKADSRMSGVQFAFVATHALRPLCSLEHRNAGFDI